MVIVFVPAGGTVVDLGGDAARVDEGFLVLAHLSERDELVLGAGQDQHVLADARCDPGQRVGLCDVEYSGESSVLPIVQLALESPSETWVDA